MAYATLKSLRIDCALCCDSIRREDNGKLLLIGVYQKDVLVRNFPAELALQFYVIGTFTSAPPESAWLRLLTDGDPTYSVELTLPEETRDSYQRGDSNFKIVLPPAKFLIRESSDIKLEVKDRERESWQAVLTVPVRAMGKAEEGR